MFLTGFSMAARLLDIISRELSMTHRVISLFRPSLPARLSLPSILEPGEHCLPVFLVSNLAYAPRMCVR